MLIRSDPLGPPSAQYPVSEYELPLPRTYEYIDIVRIEKLELRPVPSSGSEVKDSSKPLTYDAAVQFAINGRSWPLRLSYDVSFISSYPCSYGPHPLFFDYVYKIVRVDEILAIRDWGGLNGDGGNIGATVSADARASQGTGLEITEDEDNAKEKVLVVEAFGVNDNEVLARAWCSHWGLSAIVADVERTWWVLHRWRYMTGY
jgi:hypothetical protein